ncbi:4-hydroxy-tetrahydrodipicolinate synthase [Roseomonas xinghualingensis]|uniref:4-hydroxy-tetrahydrodipicolinate synthase n=1 Tax=Roseomonas xinghualingensis TaxID=2986475 RepID=UPI0021F129DC|nr:4-hydroxy-tetrahydrodipicolinate synthase [Roseomonas sp. SXEYE001]MCV4209187.1 4-hydroxy-tetrahydrodipicolinate synthase [Roseomonas sp. SXEYE001]
MRPPPTLRGVLPALVTPFRADDSGELDLAALSRLTARAVSRGVGGLVVCGSTGEAPALTPVEHARAVACVAEAAGGLPVVAGVGAPCTEAAVALAVAAEHVGATALLVSAPPYVKPGQVGLRAHVRAIVAATGLPVVLYDVPSRAGITFADETIVRLFEEGHIHALKDASGDLSRPPRLAQLCGPQLVQLSGDDATTLAHLAMGGQGCVSVTANLAPALCTILQSAFAARDMSFAATLRDLLAPLNIALFAEVNPIPVKAGLGVLGLCAPGLRLPLTRAEQTTVERLTRLLVPIMEREEATAASLQPRRARQVA